MTKVTESFVLFLCVGQCSICRGNRQKEQEGTFSISVVPFTYLKSLSNLSCLLTFSQSNGLLGCTFPSRDTADYYLLLREKQVTTTLTV